MFTTKANVKASKFQKIVNYRQIRFLKSKNTQEKTTFPFWWIFDNVKTLGYFHSNFTKCIYIRRS